jgi:RecJ-like exonuclease
VQVTIVGKIVSVHDTSTSVDFEVNDGTGIVEVKHWRDAEDEVCSS